ncbi:MAG: hypothetical protein ACYC3I_27635 [Gemmataceae bacterium]
MHRKSRDVADCLGISYYALFELLRGQHLIPPEKDSSGDYVWTAEDIERAQKALAHRRRKPRGGQEEATRGQ